MFEHSLRYAAHLGRTSRTGKKPKDVTERLGKPSELRNVEETRQRAAKDILPKIASHVAKARADTQKNLVGLNERRLAMKAQHSEERSKLDSGQQARANQEAIDRAARFRKGLGAMWIFSFPDKATKPP